jgi:hypothetical protein
MRTYECEPTLDDNQVLDFCKNGFLMLEGVVSEDINERVREHYGTTEAMPRKPNLLNEDWFVESVILNPQAAGAVRSLLGNKFVLPNNLGLHRKMGSSPGQRWHRDGNSPRHGVEVNFVQVMYVPQDVPLEMGPTEMLPGSHFLFSQGGQMGHYGGIRGSYKAIAPAGSIYMHNYHLWHRGSPSTGTGIRDMLKYTYWRTSPPKRDWVIDPDFDVAMADYALEGTIPKFRAQFRDCQDSAEMFYWMMGRSEEFRVIGGHSWPIQPAKSMFTDKSYWAPGEKYETERVN